MNCHLHLKSRPTVLEISTPNAFEMQTQSTSPENATLVQLVRPKTERKKGKGAFLNAGRKRYEISVSIRMNTHLCVYYKYNIYSCFQMMLSKLIVNDLKVSTYK